MVDDHLAAMIAAVRLEFESYEGSVRTSDDPHVASLGAALRLLEALADREDIARALCRYPAGPSDANSCCVGAMGYKRCQREADKLLAAFFARAEGGKPERRDE